MAKVLLERLNKQFNETVAVADVSLEVHDQEFLVLVGPSGCGKTTTLRLIAGLEETTSGKIIIGDSQVNDLPPPQRDIAMVFQNYALYPHMSVFDNMTFGLKLQRLPQVEIHRRVQEAANILNISDLLQRKPRELSGGQRQRVALGRAIVRKPKVFLFDEPLSNLDAELRVQMRVELRKLHERLKSTIIYVTHDQVEAMTMGDRIVIMKDGRIQQVGSPSDVYLRPVNLFVARFIGSPQMNLIMGEVDKNSLIFKSEGVVLDLSNLLPENWNGSDGRILTVGIRPEDLEVTGSEAATLHGEVELIEDLGSDQHAHVRCDGQVFIARLPSQAAIYRGDTLHLSTRKGRLHLFADGQRLN